MLLTAFLPTSLGLFEIRGSMLGVQSVRLSTKGDVSDEIPEDHPVAVCRQQMEEYLNGQRRYFDFPLDWGGAPDFYRQVWEVVRNIPYGKTMYYSEIADLLGQPKAVRAVGMANRSNPIAIVVPCHRVIGKGGELRGYFYGLDFKMALLRHENPERFAEQTTLDF